MPTDLELTSDQENRARSVFKNDTELELFWQDLYSKVKDDLKRWEEVRARSEEDARNLWLRSA